MQQIIRQIDDWSLFWSAVCGVCAIASVVVAILFYLKSEKRNLSRIRSDQLLIAIEKLYVAENLITYRVSTALLRAGRAKNFEGFINSFIGSTESISPSESAKDKVSLVIAGKILSVYPEPNLVQELNRLNQMANTLTIESMKMPESNNEHEWRSIVVRLFQLHTTITENVDSLNKAVNKVDLRR